MITIIVDLREATKEEAEAYGRSETRKFLLYRSGIDLAPFKPTIRLESGGHFVEGSEGDSCEKNVEKVRDEQNSREPKQIL